MKKTKLVTCAFPYANGPIHLGHMLEHIQADIWVRYQRMMGNRVYFICSDDTHGTPIMLKSKRLGISPKTMIDRIRLEHLRDLSKFNISYDHYCSTNSETNRILSISIYKKLKKKGFIKTRNIFQLFDSNKNMFLPDRFVKGNCPKCHVPSQYGDNCTSCGATYASSELINPISMISGTIPTIRKSKHYFFELSSFDQMLRDWIKSSILQNQVLKKVREWFFFGLKPWNISRDPPYFGFKIPETNKYFYVWFDAAIGYISAFKKFSYKRKDVNFYDFWRRDSKIDFFQFIGKDIIYFHSLFWPAILEGIGLRKPTNLFVHGYVTINGKKISKSVGNFISAHTYLKYLEPDGLRYYYATNLSSKIVDINLNLENFFHRINSDILNKVVNLASRSASLINRFFNGKLRELSNFPRIYQNFIEKEKIISDAYNRLEISSAVKEIIKLANTANQYINSEAPWELIKRKDFDKAQLISSIGIEFFKILVIYLKPVLPNLAKKSEIFLNSSLNWNKIHVPLSNHRIGPFKRLFHKIKKSTISSMIEDSLNNIER